ncbi:PREDICTED: uncharacterized protein LOC108974876 [Bactrocera latifrons]|uniref:uncharacterized protein LOC108974876 n=1 Tax=Bactrocera latifrons TaxID=174628 RepID=UPI0008DC7387|nr:PREDICTED: uncharacterized protein LOC108974876 [Bactrocera latifrons]
MALISSTADSDKVRRSARYEAKTNTNIARSFRFHATNLKCEHTVPNIIEFFECHLTWRNNCSYSSGALVLRKPIIKLKANVVLDIFQANVRLVNVFNKTALHLKILQLSKMCIKFKASALVFLLLVVQTCRGQRSKSPRFESKTESAGDSYLKVSAIKCTTAAPTVIEYFQCYLIRRNGSNLITFTLSLLQPVERFDMNAVFDILGPTNNYYNIFKTDLNCCEFFLVKKHSIYIVNNIMKLVYDAINEKPTCPVKAHFNFKITELDVSLLKVPNYVPKSNFRLGLYFRSDGRRAADIMLSGVIVNSK